MLDCPTLICILYIQNHRFLTDGPEDTILLEPPRPLAITALGVILFLFLRAQSFVNYD